MSTDRDNSGRFLPGQTGNAKGRPKGHRSVNAAIDKALQEKVTVTEQGRRRRKSKLDITATQIANQGASGDLRAARMVLEQARKAEEEAAEAKRMTASSEVPLTPCDQEIVERFLADYRRHIEETGQ